MKTKFTFISLLIGLISINSFSQSDSIDYLGQTPPSDIPKVFALGIVSVSDRYEYGLSVSPDGNEIFFTCEQPGIGLMRIVKNGDTWSSPQLANLRKINAWEFEAFYKNSGDTLFFTSRTSQNSGKDQFYFVIKNGAEWGDAQKLISPVNDNTVMWSSFAKNGNLYYANEDDNYVYVSKYNNGEYFAGTKINAGMHPYPAPDESFFLFDNNGSIFIRFKSSNGEGWNDAILLGNSINTSSWEGNASLSPDGKYMFFARYNDTGGKSDIYWINTDFIKDLKPQTNSIKQVLEQNILVYPNPTIDNLNISFGSLQYKTATVGITDISGKVLLSNTFHNLSSTTIDLKDKPKGIYILNLSVDGEILNKKLSIE
jgi:hypothetical protein